MTEPESIKQVRRALDLLVLGDVDGMLELTDSSPEYHNPPDAMDAGVRRGSEQFGTALRNMADGFDFDAIEIQRWAAQDESQALVEVRAHATGKHSGAPVNQHFVYHFAFNEGRISRVEWFRDWDTATESAGVERDKWGLSS